MDQHLIKYYEADTEAGILDDEKALGALRVKFITSQLQCRNYTQGEAIWPQTR